MSTKSLGTGRENVIIELGSCELCLSYLNYPNYPNSLGIIKTKALIASDFLMPLISLQQLWVFFFTSAARKFPMNPLVMQLVSPWCLATAGDNPVIRNLLMTQHSRQNWCCRVI